MIAVAIALSLTAAAIHGTWNVLIKVSGDPIVNFGRATLASAVAATISVIPVWLWLGRPSLNAAALSLCLVSSVLETAYLWLLSAAYRRGDISAAYPIARGTAPLIAVAVGIILFGERLTPIQFAGVALLLGGILGVTISQAGGRATVPALLTGVVIATYTSVDRLGVRLGSPWVYGWLLFVLMAVELQLTTFVAARIGLRVNANPPPWRRAAVIGSFMWVAYFLVLWALSVAPLAVVAPVREVSIVAVAAWGVWRLRERRGAAMKLSGAVAAVAGVALLAT